MKFETQGFFFQLSRIMFLNEDNSENKSVVHIDAETETFRPNSFYISNFFFTEFSMKSGIIIKNFCYYILIKLQKNVFEK